MRARWSALIIAFLFAAGAAFGQDMPRLSPNWTPSHWFDKPASPRLANYRISASVDFEKHLLDGKETLTWKNGGTAPTRELPLHLYLNAFKGPSSLFVKESGGQLRGDTMTNTRSADSWGYCRLISAKLNGVDLEGHAGEDETVWWLRLPHAVDPGQSIDIDIQWQSRFPRVFARSGWSDGFLMAGQWFPKAGVYQGAAWNCHAYHAWTEFFSDFGVYDVDISIPLGFRLAHTGTAVPYRDPATKGDMDAWPDPKDKNRMVYKLHAEDVHDFAFAMKAQINWNRVDTTYRGIQVFYYTEAENLGNLPRQKRSIENALRWSEDWYFKYPYPTLTVIDTPKDASGADGMEYPTLITASSVDFDPFQLRMEPEVVSVHEFGHQYFYGMLASNEFEEPWLDEGFNSWFTAKAMEETYHGLFSSRRLSIPVDMEEWGGYWAGPSMDPLTRKGWLVKSQFSYFVNAYSKPTMVLDQLEALLGRPVMEQVMRAYTHEMGFKHPTRGDFKRIAERVSGRDLSAFWRDFVEGTGILDYQIDAVSVRTRQQGGWMDGPQGPKFSAPGVVAEGRSGAITLVRKGEIQVPVTLWVRLENKKELRLVWDGQDRWHTFTEDDGLDAPVAAAVLDPDGNYPMLKDRLHASWTAAPATRGLHYWGQLLWGGLAALLQGAGIG